MISRVCGDSGTDLWTLTFWETLDFSLDAQIKAFCRRLNSNQEELFDSLKSPECMFLFLLVLGGDCLHLQLGVNYIPLPEDQG